MLIWTLPAASPNFGSPPNVSFIHSFPSTPIYKGWLVQCNKDVNFSYSYKFKSIFANQRYTRFERKNILLSDSISSELLDCALSCFSLNAGLHSSFSLILVKKSFLCILLSHKGICCVSIFSLRLGSPLKFTVVSFFQASLKRESNSVSYDLIFRDIIKLPAPLTS